MRVLISCAMSRPSSARPKSNQNMLVDFSKKMVAVTFLIPGALALNSSGLS